jgi:hypothetical protein
MAFNKTLPTVENVAVGVTASVKIPVENLTLLGVLLRLGGTTFDKTKIEWIKVKVGTKTIWDLTMAQINKMNGYKNSFDNAAFVLLDFTERDQALFPVKEGGGLDLMALLGVGQVIVEIRIAATAVAPTIDAEGIFSRNQGNPWVLKMLRTPYSRAAAGSPVLPMNPRGALLKRVWLDYTGTNWGAAADGNVSRVEVKKNGYTIFDRTCRDNRVMQSHFKKVPQANMYVIDFIEDNNHDAHVQTVRAQGNISVYDEFEFKSTLTDAGGSNIDIITEALDAIGNL